MELKFIGNNDGPSIEKYLVEVKHHYGQFWRHCMIFKLSYDAAKWWTLNGTMLMTLSNEEFEQAFIDKWSNAKKKDNASPNSLSSLQVQRSVQIVNLIKIQLDEVKKVDTNGLSSGGISLLHVHGCIQQERVIVYTNPHCKHNFINVHIEKKLQVSPKHIQSTQVDGGNVQVFKDLKITLDKYALHSNFQAIDMDNVDIVLAYPWMQSIGTINLNIEKKFLKLWCKKKKVTL